MKLIKNILKYVALLAIIAFSVLLVTIGIMFVSAKINPDNPIKIFGYAYFDYSDKGKHSLLFNDEDFDAIEFNVKSLDVEVSCLNAGGYMQFNNNNRMWGFAKVEKGVKYGKSYEIKNRILKITVTEPEGFFFNRKISNLHLQLTRDYSAKNLYVVGENSTITVGGGNNLLDIQSLFFDVNNSKIVVGKLKNDISQATINSNNNTVKIVPNIALKLDIKTNTSNFEFNNIKILNVEAENLQLKANKVEQTNFVSKKGIINFNESGNISVTGNVKTTITTLNGTYTDLNRTNAKLKIENAVGSVESKSTSGEVEINKATGGVNVETTIANITLKNIACGVNVKTTSGICKVDFSNQVETNAEFNFMAKNGSLTANNIPFKTTVNVENDGYCILTLNFKNLVGENVINAQKGNVSVVAPIKACVLNVSGNGEKDIAYADLISKSNVENALISGATENTETKLTITSTSGKITIKSQS